MIIPKIKPALLLNNPRLCSQAACSVELNKGARTTITTEVHKYVRFICTLVSWMIPAIASSIAACRAAASVHRSYENERFQMKGGEGNLRYRSPQRPFRNLQHQSPVHNHNWNTYQCSLSQRIFYNSLSKIKMSFIKQLNRKKIIKNLKNLLQSWSSWGLLLESQVTRDVRTFQQKYIIHLKYYDELAIR